MGYADEQRGVVSGLRQRGLRAIDRLCTYLPSRCRFGRGEARSISKRPRRPPHHGSHRPPPRTHRARMVCARVERRPPARHRVDGQSPRRRRVSRRSNERRTNIARRSRVKVHCRLERGSPEIEDHHPPTRHPHFRHLRCRAGRHSARSTPRLERRFLETHSRPVLDRGAPGACALRTRNPKCLQQPWHGGALVRHHRLSTRRGYSLHAEAAHSRSARCAREPVVYRLRPCIRGGRIAALRELGRRNFHRASRRADRATHDAARPVERSRVDPARRRKKGAHRSGDAAPGAQRHRSRAGIRPRMVHQPGRHLARRPARHIRGRRRVAPGHRRRAQPRPHRRTQRRRVRRYQRGLLGTRVRIRHQAADGGGGRARSLSSEPADPRRGLRQRNPPRSHRQR